MHNSTFRSAAFTTAFVVAIVFSANSIVSAQGTVFPGEIQSGSIQVVTPVANAVPVATNRVVAPAAEVVQKKIAAPKQLLETVKVYPVGNLISAAAMRAAKSGVTTVDQWQSEYPDTIEAIDELESIIKTICSKEPIAIKVYKPSLSLIVRHTQSGHEEIADLLRSLANDQTQPIELTFSFLYADSVPKLGNEYDETDLARMEGLLSKKVLSAKETSELRELIPKKEGMHNKVTIAAAPGKRTPWLVFGQAYTALARFDQQNKTTQLRIDYIADELHDDMFGFGSDVFTLPEGHSALLNVAFDGAHMVWIVTANSDEKKADDETSETVSEGVPQIATKPK